MQHHDLSFVLLCFSAFFFALGAFSRWAFWGPDNRPFYSSFVSAGLLCFVVSVLLKS